MAKKVSENNIHSITEDWGRDTSNDLPYSGAAVLKFIKDTFDTKVGCFYYDVSSNRYLVFANESKKNEYVNNPTLTELVIGTFDAPFNYEASITLLTPQYNAIFLGSTGNYVDFTFDVKNKSGNSTGENVNVTYTFIRNATKRVINETRRYGETVHMNIDEYLLEGTNTVIIGIQGQTSLAATTASITYQVINLSFQDEMNISKVYDLSKGNQTVEVFFNVSGYGTKIVEWFLDGEQLPFVKSEDEVIDVTSSRTKYIELSNLANGIHTLQSRAYTIINGEKFYTDTLYRELMVTSGNNNDNMLAIATTLPHSHGLVSTQNALTLYGAEQYIPYTIRFATRKSGDVLITLDNNALTTLHATAGSEVNYTLTYNKAGVLKLSFAGNGVNREVPISINNTSLNIEEITTQLTFDFNANGKSNSAVDKDVWSYGNYTGTFSGFNWNATSGWVNNALLLNSGASFSVDIQPLLKDATSTGKTLEFEFSTQNVEDDNAVVCDLTVNGVGLKITASEARITSAAGEYVNTKFKAGEVNRIAFVINRKTSVTYKGLVFIYVNGILSGAINYGSADNFISSATLSFHGTDDAQVSLRSMRFYDTALSADNILNNYILYRDTLIEMMEVYYRNDIYEIGTSNFSVDLLAHYLPVMIIVGDIPTLEAATSTSTLILVDIQFIHEQDPTKSFTMKRVALRIQGTSSLAYPRKNFRFYTRVEESSLVYDYEGNLIPDKLYQFIDNAQPVDCWCLKADFAESSGTHNTGIARIWNKVMYGAVIQHTNILGEETNGYALRTEAQKIALEQDYKNDVRTTIDGFPIVLFYKQKESDTDLIFLGKYNFNNDKSTPSVFGFENIPGFDNARMQCWETKDNGHPLGLFTDVSNFDRDWSEAFESRYPDTKTPNTADLKAFSQWMSTVSQEDFATQKWAHMDVYKVAAYYVYLMRFGAVDQPVKNGFLTSEDGQKFYYINYDNDTINGLINTGELRLDPTITRQTIGTDGEYVYAGHSSVLWNRCEADTEFMDIVSIVDNALYSAGLRYDEVMSVFNDEQCDKWAERVYNQDAEYKYLLPYVNQATNNLFMLQGSRSSHRSWWLSKRFALYDSLFVSGAYRDRNVSFKCLNDTQPGQKFTITAGTDMNYGYGVNNGIRETGVELNSGDTRTFTTTDTLNLGDVVKIFGASDLAQLDLSQLASRLAVLDCSAASDTVLGSKMKKLLIGGNGNVNTELSSISGINKLTSLQELNIEDYQAITSLDLTALKDMRKVYAHGSGVASIDFAPGTPIEHLELPSAMLALNLNQLPYLTTNNLVVENGLNSVNSIAISGCPNLSNNFDFAFNWLTAEENLGKEFFMDNIEWKYASVSKLIEIGQVMAANPKIKLMGKVIVLSITIEQIDILRNLFGDNVFENFADFSIKAPESIFLSAPESINEGESAQFLAVIFSDFKGTVEYSIYSGSRTGVTIDSATGLLSSTETGYSDSTLTIRAVHTSTAGVITFVDRSIRILKRTYPTSIKISGNSNVGKEDVYTASISPTEYTGNPIIVWTVTGVAVTEGYLEMVSQSSSECRVRVLKRDLVETKNATVKCSIYKSDGATLITEASKTISVKAYTYPTSVSISGPDTIRRSDTYNLVYSPTSFDGEIINVAWAVSDDLVSFAAIGEHDEHHCEIIITDTVVGVAFGTISVIIMLGNGKELTASKDVTILDSTVLMTSQSNSGAMAAMYASGLCANKDYMTYEEAAAVTNETIQGLSSIGSLYDFVEFEYFTGLTEIPDNAFNHVRNLRQIKLPPQITRIGKKAFGSSSSNHTQLTSITIPDNVKLIDEGAFSYIPQLKSLDLGNGVERIAQRAFYETSLTSLHIPPSVKILETHAFNGTQAVSGGVGLFQLKSLSGCVGLEQLSFGAFGRIFAGDVVFADEVPFGKFNHDYPDLFVSGITSDAYLTILYDKDLDVPIVKDGAYFDDKSKVKTIKVTRESDRNINTLLPVGFSTLVISSNLPAETFRVSYIHIDTEERVEEILPVGSHLLRMKPDYGKVIVSAAVELEDMELLPMEHGSSHYTWLRTFEAKFFERVTFYIQRNDGTLYTEKEWDDSGLTYIEANGIAAIHKDVSFVVNKSLISGPGFVLEQAWVDSGLGRFNSLEDALLDYDGYDNTIEIANALDPVVTDASTAFAFTFPNGLGGYLGSIKEMSVLIPKWEILDRLVKKIGGSSIFVKYKYIRTSSIFYDADYNTLYKLKVASVYMDESYEEMNINESGLNSSHYILPIGKIITPTVCKSLTITAEDVQWYDTLTNVSWEAVVDGIDRHSGAAVQDIVMRGTYIYDFGVQNKGESVLEHTVSYTYLGVTRSTTFMQGAFSSESFFIDLNNQWRLSPTVANPDSAIYEGVYESFSNRGIASVEAKMTIHLFGRSSFRFYIRSYGESSYDYVMVSQLDKDLNNSTSYTAADVKAHTRGKSTSGTSLSNYTLVEYTNISEGDHFITVVYIKDSSSDSGTDSGYVLIPKNQ